MDEILQRLNKACDNKYQFLKIYEVIYDKASSLCTFTFLYPLSHEDMTSENRTELEGLLKNVLSLNANVRVKFKKSFLDEVLIRREIANFFKNEKKALAPYIFEDNIEISREDDQVVIKIKLNQDIFAMISELDLKNALLSYLNEKFIASFSIEIEENEDTVPDEIDAPDIIPISSNKVERYEVEVLKKIVGSEINPKPEYIKNNKKPKSMVILAGKISNIVKKTFKIKKGKKAGEEKAFYTFTLDDGDKIDCLYFCSKTHEKVMDSLQDDMFLLCFGDINVGLSGNNTYYVKKISWAQKKEKIETAQTSSVAENDYSNHKQVVFPEKIELTTQAFLFDKQINYNDNVKGKNVVVFDIETTGLNFEEDEITEIGAVKIVDGVIKEKFATFVKPTKPIPEEVKALTHITDDMVKDAPSIRDVIYDFKAFCDNCVLCGHNVVGFDFKFIKKAAEKNGLYFKNQIIDTLVLARTSSLRLANYKLGTIVAALGLTLEGAHRAYNDALATAQVFLELSKVKSK